MIMSNIAKISIEKFDNKDQILYDFDKTKSLDENVRTICKILGLPESKVYGLKYLPTRINEKNHYISQNNLNDIKHTDCLKVVFSVKYIINRIVTNIHSEEQDLRRIVFGDIMKLSLDPVFIEEIAESENDKLLIDVFLNDHLNSYEQLGLLKVIVHLFSKGFIDNTSQNILQKATNILKNSDTTNEELRFTLSLLQKILVSPHEELEPWKERIVRDVPLKDLNPYIWRDCRDLQYSALLLINTIIKISKGDKKQQLIKEMNFRKTRENIYNKIIMEGNLDKNMEHELYVLQTYLLSLFSEALNSHICLDDNSFFRREIFELCPEDMRRITILMDFDEANIQNTDFLSVENLAFNNRNSITSTNSIKSDDSLRGSSKRSSIRCYLDNEDTYEDTISHLTLESLKHYKNLHPRNFYQSQIEEQLYEPGIFVTSERVVRMLAKMLHIGLETPDTKSTFYQPVVFYCSSRTPFFLELFSRTMWLLSRTRREMKASTFADYEKVMYILQKQVRAALKNKPKDFKNLTAEMSATSFNTALEKIKNDKEAELNHLIETHPCMQEVKLKFVKENEANIFQQRVKVLLQGSHFPRVLEKKTHGNIFVQLSKNMRDLMVYDIIDAKLSEKCTFREKIKINSITHVVIGKNCKHANLCQNPALAFSIVADHEHKIKFIADDERTASYWTDALLLLINQGTPERLSKFYADELNELVRMDLRLQILDLQNIPIPRKPPPVPPPPEITKPDLPPKPKPRKFDSGLK